MIGEPFGRQCALAEGFLWSSIINVYLLSVSLSLFSLCSTTGCLCSPGDW